MLFRSFGKVEPPLGHFFVFALGFRIGRALCAFGAFVGLLAIVLGCRRHAEAQCKTMLGRHQQRPVWGAQRVLD